MLRRGPSLRRSLARHLAPHHARPLLPPGPRARPPQGACHPPLLLFGPGPACSCPSVTLRPASDGRWLASTSSSRRSRTRTTPPPKPLLPARCQEVAARPASPAAAEAAAAARAVAAEAERAAGSETRCGLAAKVPVPLVAVLRAIVVRGGEAEAGAAAAVEAASVLHQTSPRRRFSRATTTEQHKQRFAKTARNYSKTLQKSRFHLRA